MQVVLSIVSIIDIDIRCYETLFVIAMTYFIRFALLTVVLTSLSAFLARMMRVEGAVASWQRTAEVEGRRIDWPPFTHSDFWRTGEELSKDVDAISLLSRLNFPPVLSPSPPTLESSL